MRFAISVVVKLTAAVVIFAEGMDGVQADTAVASASTPGIEEAIANYCLNITDKAKEERIARQTAHINSLEDELDTKVKELETRRMELQDWVEKRERLRSAAEKELVDIYAAMDPEVAARQMENSDAQLGSSVLRQLKPRQASAILNEMKPDAAASLVKIMSVSIEPGPSTK